MRDELVKVIDETLAADTDNDGAVTITSGVLRAIADAVLERFCVVEHNFYEVPPVLADETPHVICTTCGAGRNP